MRGPRALSAGLLLPALAAQDLADLPLLRGERFRASTSADPAGSNEDHSHYRAVLADGTRVLADFEGPGRLVRLWSANPEGRLVLEVDGGQRFDGAFRGLFDGPPLAAPFAGGFLSYAEVPFERRCRLLAPAGPGTYYQVAALCGERPRAVELRAPDAEVAMHCRVREARQLFALEGPGELVALRLRLRRGDPRALVLSVHCDGATEPCWQAPVDLALPDDLPTRATGSADGWRELRLPMPFRRSIALAAHCEGAEAEFDLGYVRRALPADHARGYLHGVVQRAQNVWGEPFPVLAVRGHGHFVGLVAVCIGAPGQGLAFLEGDERITVDGALALQGTGTEDFFGGGWYFRGHPAGSPFAAVAAIDERLARVRAARFCVVDPIPFTARLRFDLEHGGGNDAAGSDYTTLAWYYDADPAAAPPPAAAEPLPWTAPAPPPQWESLAPLLLWPEYAAGDGARLPAGAHELSARDWPMRWTLRRGGRDVARPVDVEAGATPRFELGEAVLADEVRGEIVLPAIRSWRVAGPFPGGGRRGIDTVFAPEQDWRDDATYDVLGDGPRTWRELPPAAPNGVVDLDAVCGHRDEVVAYVATWVTSPRDQDAVLWLGSDDAVQVFLDGARVHEHRGLRGVARDQDRVPLHLPAGEHALLIKVEDYAGGFGVFARIDGATGLSFRAFRR